MHVRGSLSKWVHIPEGYNTFQNGGYFGIMFFFFAGDFLKTLQDSDLNVRRVALAMFNSAAHNKPSLIRDQLSTVLPHLYNETKIRRELIREVQTWAGIAPLQSFPRLGKTLVQTHCDLALLYENICVSSQGKVEPVIWACSTIAIARSLCISR